MCFKRLLDAAPEYLSSAGTVSCLDKYLLVLSTQWDRLALFTWNIKYNHGYGWMLTNDFYSMNQNTNFHKLMERALNHFNSFVKMTKRYPTQGLTYVLDIVQISGSRNLFVAKGRFLKILENAYISKYVIQEIHLLSLNLELKVIL